MAKIPLSLPIHDYRVTSGFGPRLDPFKKRAAFHAGVDFGTATGTPVYATLSGTVTRSGYKGPYGLVVEIDHGNGFRSRYGHLARSRVRRGQAVEFQQHIADAGNSGRSTGPHLHYEVLRHKKPVNPRDLDVPPESALDAVGLEKLRNAQTAIGARINALATNDNRLRSLPRRNLSAAQNR